MKGQKGFTLIELMIVVAIIGILAAFAVPAYQNYTKKTHAAEMLSAASAMKTAVGVCLLSGKTDCTSATADGVPATQQFKKSNTDSFTVTSYVNNPTSTASATLSIKAEVDTTGKGGLDQAFEVQLMPALTSNGVVWSVSCAGGTTPNNFCPSK
ncbi:prepilin-type N-terminal cleavage/methylation domain-containing protein [Photobacterium damselae subsp. damselae]|uniref:pilin n=1 Tax=Photobacterium damselae TaxID=38293 RepID=UPI0015935519|nr:prepilin-type N-terminal cleavage/methylation domain-containing protein [Photobacterium damselae]NVH50170.1 prepilin-type N-terminal cleavage/methylation domain-containing protein [Photobacterium damselae subsp. damselae]NVO79906.1 prepilin-type N-terminal cleavage/methylation domain-containing protein [Photobacterium damselae subsp. damselae]